MAGGFHRISCATVAAGLLLASDQVAGQDTCTSVTVSGGDYPGTYQLGSGTTYTEEGSTVVLQAVSFGERRSRRGLVYDDAGNGALRGGGTGRGSNRLLANDCESQMWILTDPDAMVDGFPYYSTFDCATNPSEIDSTWLYVECDDCAEVSALSVTCTTAVGAEDTADDGGDDSIFTIPVIVGFVAVGVLILICLGYCAMRFRSSPRKGNSTFADDSEHPDAHKLAAASAVSGASTGHVMKGHSNAQGKGVMSPAGETATSPMGFMGKAQNSKSFKGNHEVADTPAYEGIFSSHAGSARGSHPSSYTGSRHPGSVEMERRASPEAARKDSMVAAAAAARSRAMGAEPGPPAPLPSVLRNGGGASSRPPPGAGVEGGAQGITWSAGQNLDHRGPYEPSDFGDSAAGSVYNIAGPDDAVQQHTYHECDDSVAASSPGAYSMYSHYTAGGGTYAGGQDSVAWSSDDDEDEEYAKGTSRRQPLPPSHRQAPNVHVHPPPAYDDEDGEDGEDIGERELQSPAIQQQRGAGGVRHLSPAGFVARADRKSRR